VALRYRKPFVDITNGPLQLQGCIDCVLRCLGEVLLKLVPTVETCSENPDSKAETRKERDDACLSQCTAREHKSPKDTQRRKCAEERELLQRSGFHLAQTRDPPPKAGQPLTEVGQPFAKESQSIAEVRRPSGEMACPG
jgi:hypothetical protein